MNRSLRRALAILAVGTLLVPVWAGVWFGRMCDAMPSTSMTATSVPASETHQGHASAADSPAAADHESDHGEGAACPFGAGAPGSGCTLPPVLPAPEMRLPMQLAHAEARAPEPAPALPALDPHPLFRPPRA
ncbi:MAG: hypothetical protein KC645_14155 [Gemmatimonadetes bacterium]|nr:hypothetical protein [Gemmatimonadota bacterium]